MNSIRDKVRQATDQSNVGAAIEVVVANLNQVLRGWGGYFRYGSSSRKFAIIDSYVHERLAIFDSTKHGRRGRNWQRQSGRMHGLTGGRWPSSNHGESDTTHQRSPVELSPTTYRCRLHPIPQLVG